MCLGAARLLQATHAEAKKKKKKSDNEDKHAIARIV
jgi:hypothetical protein